MYFILLIINCKCRIKYTVQAKDENETFHKVQKEVIMSMFKTGQAKLFLILTTVMSYS